MVQVAVNYLAIIVAVVASHVLGFLWYGPLFGKQWRALMKFTEKDMKKAKEKGMTKSIVLMTICSILTAYIMSLFIKMFNYSDISGAIRFAFLIWLGFVATVVLNSVTWEGKSWNLYFINASYCLVNLAVVASILVSWP